MAGQAAPLLRTLSGDPSVLVDAGGDLVAARGDTWWMPEAFGAGSPPIAACGSPKGEACDVRVQTGVRGVNGDGRSRTT